MAFNKIWLVFFVLILFFLIYIKPALAQTAWHLSNWSYRQIFNISQPKANNIAFLTIPKDSQIFSRSQNNGKDLRVVDNLGTSLPFVIKEWSKEQKKAILAIKLLNPVNIIFVYTGNPAAPNGETPSQVYLKYDSFLNLNNWTVINGTPQIKHAPWINAWTAPLPENNIGPSVILDNTNTIAPFLRPSLTETSLKILKSQNSGYSWSQLSQIGISPENKLSPENALLTRFIFKASNNNLFTSFDGEDGIFKSENNGQTWSKSLDFKQIVNTTIPDDYPENCLKSSADPNHINSTGQTVGRSMTEFTDLPGTLLAGLYSQGNNTGETCAAVFKSTDYGRNWIKVWPKSSWIYQCKYCEPGGCINGTPESPASPGRHIHFIVADPTRTGIVYMGIGDDFGRSYILKSINHGDSWEVLLGPCNNIPANKGFYQPIPPVSASYWQPTTIEFDSENNCRIFGTDFEFDPIIYRSCGNDLTTEKNVELVYRPNNQRGYYYWSNHDIQNNNYFGFFAHPGLNNTNILPSPTDKMDSFIVATAPGGDFKKGDLWQKVSILGSYTTSSPELYKEKGGTTWGSNFFDNKSLISTVEKKPYLLEIGNNQITNIVETTNSEIQLNLPSLNNESFFIDFNLALKSSTPINPNQAIPLSGSLFLANTSGNKQIGALIKSKDNRPDLWYIYAENSEQVTDETRNSLISFSLNTWYKIRFLLNTIDKTWKLCLPDYKYCSQSYPLNYPQSLPSKLIVRASGIITKLTSELAIGAYKEGNNIVSASSEEEIPNCLNGTLGNLDCDSLGKIDGADLTILTNSWAPNGPVPTPAFGQRTADLNSDGKVDEIDLTILLKNWR